MKKVWTSRWKKALIWISGYLSFIAFAVVGGYTIVKSEDEDLKKTAKTAFIVTLIFTALSALYSILSSINAIAGYNQGLSEFLSWFNMFQRIAEIAVYAFFVLASLFIAKDEDEKAAKEPEAEARAESEQESKDGGTKE